MSEHINEEVVEESSTVQSVADFITSRYSQEINEGGQGAEVEMTPDGKSSFDAEGKGPMLPEPVNADAAKNQNSLKPAGEASGEEEGEEDTTRKEHLEVLFSGEELSEEFKEKAETIFEAALSERVSQVEESLLESYNKQLSENTESILKDLSEKLDDYLNYVVEEWLKENELVVENGIRTEVTENFILGLRGLFESSYIDVPSEKYDLLDGLFEQNELLENHLNDYMHTNKELVNELNRLNKTEAFMEVADGLASTDAERLASLTESISDECTVDEFKNKLQTLKENYFNTNSEETTTPTELVEEVNEESTHSRIITEDTGPSVMDNYVNTLSRHAKANKVS